MEVAIRTEKKPDVVILLGGPASGKGTQAKILAERTGYSYFGTGDLLRAEMEKGSQLGKKIAGLMNSGELVPDDLTNPLVARELAKIKGKGIVLDGYPRNLDQAENLQDIFPDENFLLINITASVKSLLKRMQSRRICDKCGKIYTITNDKSTCDVCGGKLIQRTDDSQEVLKKRINAYEELTKPIIAYYRQKGLVREVDGEPPIPAVTKQIEEII